jgi:hypothetical protein
MSENSEHDAKAALPRVPQWGRLRLTVTCACFLIRDKQVDADPSVASTFVINCSELGSPLPV